MTWTLTFAIGWALALGQSTLSFSAFSSPQEPAPGSQTEKSAASEAPAQAEEKSAPAKPKTSVRHTKKATRQPPAQNGKVVVSNGGARDHSTQLAPGMSQEQAERQRENTNQLLATTDANLKQVAGRGLSSAEQSMMDQIQSYLRQAKTAEQSGDVTRAYTLAYKAQLLSTELAHK